MHGCDPYTENNVFAGVCRNVATTKQAIHRSESLRKWVSRWVIHDAMILDIVDFRYGCDTILPHDPRVKHHELGSRLPGIYVLYVSLGSGGKTSGVIEEAATSKQAKIKD
uniref:Uncharacterized protein n=1 Tax=Trichogramma kaykai TaxID=54128 RepID=A0ABD2XA51_9HYME